jgi:DNA-binding LacI/PurR family transcriptional regulator
MAIAGHTALRERGINVPGEMSLIAWDDSVPCQLAGMSALSHDVGAYGALAAETMLATLRGERSLGGEAELPTLVARATTGHFLDRSFTRSLDM